MKIFLSDSIGGKAAEILMSVTIVGYFLLYVLLPQLGLDVVAPVLFVLFIAVFRWLIARWEKSLRANKKTIQHVFNYFLTWKLAKMLVSVALMVCYMKFFGERLVAFLISFALLYVELMWMETAAWRSVERRERLKVEH
ncbi:MAG: hypothetical protein LBJ57_09055 [Prevotellaceae bacterium]|jgi:hypothetical protein|nr:hypothetical protein [Prevotellaceae bacterium]